MEKLGAKLKIFSSLKDQKEDIHKYVRIYILGHKASLGKFKKIEIIPSIFSDHNAVRLDLNYRRKTIKIPTYGG